MSEKIFVAGASGMVGSAVVRAILRRLPKAAIKAGCMSMKPMLEDNRIEFVQGDLSDMDFCRKAVSGCDCAVMAAASTAGAAGLNNRPQDQINANLAMNSNMLSAFAETGIKRVVCIGSATLYQPYDGSISEDQLDLNIDPAGAHYGIGWLWRYMEKLCRFWHDNSDMEIVLVRLANAYGPFAKFDPAVSNFLPALIRKAVDGMDPFDIWGSGDVKRDVIFCDDAADAVVRMIEQEDFDFEIFNIGSGKAVTVDQAVRLILKYANHSPSQLKYLSDKPATIQCRVLDCRKAEKILGWKTQYSIDEGIEQTVNWWRAHKQWWPK